MRSKCGASYPHFLGGDTVSPYALNGGLDKFPRHTVDYLSQASSLAWKTGCSETPNSVGFFAVYHKLFREDACLSTISGGSLLAYDTLLIFIQGVRNTGVPRPSPDSVLEGIEDISSATRGPLHGTSGQIDYSSTDHQAILRIRRSWYCVAKHLQRPNACLCADSLTRPIPHRTNVQRHSVLERQVIPSHVRDFTKLLTKW
jgi:hypothetical protein